MGINSLYTEKQIQALRLFKKSFFLLILHGAKRSGKTIVNNDFFLLEVKRIKKLADKIGIKEPQYILSGFSLGSLERNIFTELRNKYSINIQLNKHAEFTLMGVKVCCFGHGKINDMARIRGMTAFGAYINETTTGHEMVIREILNRCSMPNSRVIMDTNPDNPEHYIKKDYIDKADDKKIIQISFNLYDNTFLSPEYIENIETVTPSGVFFNRDILGLWTTTDGAIYRDFDKEKHIIKDLSNYRFVDYVAGIDWGYSHYGALCVFGVTESGEFILLKAIKKQFEQVEYWIDEMLNIKKEYGNIKIYADTARVEHINKARHKGLNVIYADKNVMAGIEKVASLIKQNKLLIYDSSAFLSEVYKYVWDSKTGQAKKENDDLMDAIRYAIYNYRGKNLEFKIITA